MEETKEENTKELPKNTTVVDLNPQHFLPRKAPVPILLYLQGLAETKYDSKRSHGACLRAIR